MSHEPLNKSCTRREFLDKSVKTASALAVSATLPGFVAACGSGSGNDLDVLIKDATLYDGTPAKPYTADIGIKGDKIVSIGKIDGTASMIIPAQGKIVTPGFIDVHTHCDLTFQKSGSKRYLSYFTPSWKGNYNYLYQGVTTVVTGNCGSGYKNTNEWLDLVDSVNFGSNVYTLAPHGMIREQVFGKNQPGQLSPDQLSAMEKRVTEEMEKGAAGLSTGLEYAPGLLAHTDELIALARIVRQYDGVFTCHMRDESGKMYPDGKPGIIRSIKEMIEIADKADVSVQISHLKISEPINRVPAAAVLSLIEGARSRGTNLHADQYPYAAGSTIITHLLPNEMKTSDSVKDRYKTKAGRQEIVRAMKDVFLTYPPEKTMITSYGGKKSYEGKNLQEIAEIEGRPPVETYADMVCEKELPVAVYFFQDMQIVRELAPHDYVFTASDGWTVPKGYSRPHPRAYGTFTKKLKAFAMDEKRMTFQDAVRSMTSLPAEKFNMKGRGKIQTGAYADIAVWDQNKITDRATYENPHQYSEGIDWLLVNGVVSIQNGKTTGKRGGKALKRTSV